MEEQVVIELHIKLIWIALTYLVLRLEISGAKEIRENNQIGCLAAPIKLLIGLLQLLTVCFIAVLILNLFGFIADSEIIELYRIINNRYGVSEKE